MADQSNEMGMVAKVAAAQFKVFSAGRLLENYPDHAPIWNDIARAAIEAMREPTETMQWAGWRAKDAVFFGDADPMRDPGNCFRAMIDAALSHDEVKG